VLSALRGRWLGGLIGRSALVDAASDLEAMPLPRFGMRGLHQPVLQLREHLTTYDATYVALAEALQLELVTYDRAMATAPGIACDVILLEG
jgi:predicted nucleic acid-binding protein